VQNGGDAVTRPKTKGERTRRDVKACPHTTKALRSLLQEDATRPAPVDPPPTSEALREHTRLSEDMGDYYGPAPSRRPPGRETTAEILRDLDAMDLPAVLATSEPAPSPLARVRAVLTSPHMAARLTHDAMTALDDLATLERILPDLMDAWHYAMPHARGPGGWRDCPDCRAKLEGR
jgi:hypothetical protein